MLSQFGLGAIHAFALRGKKLFCPASLPAQRSGEIRLTPPTLVTLSWLAEYASAVDSFAGLTRDEVVPIEPNVQPVEGGACMLYPGDAGYVDGDVQRAGGRDRLWSLDGGLRYEKSSG